jgi:hypothetical protein
MKANRKQSVGRGIEAIERYAVGLPKEVNVFLLPKGKPTVGGGVTNAPQLTSLSDRVAWLQ